MTDQTAVAAAAPEAALEAAPGAAPVVAPPHYRLLGIPISPMLRRRLLNFRANKRGFWSLWIFLVIFIVTLFAEFVANEKPLVIYYDGGFYFPIVEVYPETTFGGIFETEADYRDPEVQELIGERGWTIWPLIPFSYDTLDYELDRPILAPPSATHWLGTDDTQRDVLARLIYGFRISVLFGLTLTVFSTVVGVAAGAIQGYFGGLLDLIAQRVIEIWESLPSLFILMLMWSLFVPGFFTLLFIMLLFSWTALVAVVRAEFLRARNFDYVRAARALGESNLRIIARHVLPNAMVATVTFMPFLLTGAITALTSLDYLGFGLPVGSASLGELIRQGKAHLEAPWLGLTAFFSIAITLSLLVFVGEAMRDAVDPRKAVGPVGGKPQRRANARQPAVAQ